MRHKKIEQNNSLKVHQVGVFTSFNVAEINLQSCFAFVFVFIFQFFFTENIISQLCCLLVLFFRLRCLILNITSLVWYIDILLKEIPSKFQCKELSRNTWNAFFVLPLSIVRLQKSFTFFFVFIPCFLRNYRTLFWHFLLLDFHRLFYLSFVLVFAVFNSILMYLRRVCKS